MDQDQLVPEVRQELKRPLAIGLVQKIGDDNQQTTLGIPGNKLSGHLEVVGLSGGLEILQKLHGRDEPMAAAPAQVRVAEIVAEGLNAHGIEPHQSDIA